MHIVLREWETGPMKLKIPFQLVTDFLFAETQLFYDLRILPDTTQSQVRRRIRYRPLLSEVAATNDLRGGAAAGVHFSLSLSLSSVY